jgi:hypothetical protein
MLFSQKRQYTQYSLKIFITKSTATKGKKWRNLREIQKAIKENKPC